MEAKRSCSDRISTLPENTIETILCRVPIKDAVRTSILARGWRYKWTKIPKVVFKEHLFQVSNRKHQLSTETQTLHIQIRAKHMIKRCEFLSAVHQVLLLRQGPIHEFTLEMAYGCETCVEIDQIILHLSRNHTLKKFTLTSCSYKLPLSIFSLHHLTDLSLCECNFDLKPTFNGFVSLKSLYLKPGEFSTKAILHLLSNCPVLKTLTLTLDLFNNDYNFLHSTTIELFKCLPAIEHLTMNGNVISCFVVDYLVARVLPISIINLKYFCFKEMCFINDDEKGLPFLALLIRSSPNLEKLIVQIAHNEDEDDYDIDFEIPYVKIEEYTDIWLDHLNEMEITNFVNSKTELDFVKLILAKSPVLKILRIFLCRDEVSNHEEMELLRILLRSPRASLAVKIFVERH